MPLFDFGSSSGPDAKMNVTLGVLPGYIDPKQPPTKKSPWNAMNDVPFVQSVDLVLPEELYDLIWHKIGAEMKHNRYAKVVMKLEDLLDGEFFTQYIKRGEDVSLSFPTWVCGTERSARLDWINFHVFLR